MNDGDNTGRELAQTGRQRLTVGQERELGRQKLVAAVESRQAEISNFLKPFNVSWDFFLSCLKVALMKTLKDDGEFFSSVTPASFLEAVLRCAMNGLLPDGKEAAIARFKDQATFMPMKEGLVKVMHRTGFVKDINAEVVTKREDDAGRFEYQEGSEGFIKHRPMLDRSEEADEIVAAYCVVRTVNGGEYREVVNRADLAKIAKVSRATKGPRVDWKWRMDQKAAIRRVAQLLPKEEGLSRVLAHDDLNYDLTLINVPDRPQAIPKGALFGNRAHVRERPALEAPAAPQGEPVAAESPPAEQEEPKAQSAVVRVVTAMLHAETLDALVELQQEARDLECDAEEQQWIAETLDAARVRLMPTIEEIETEVVDVPLGATAAESPDPPADAASPASDAGTATEVGTHGSGDTTATQDADKPVLRALITSGMAVKEYTDPEVWFSSICAQISALGNDRVKIGALYNANASYIADARAAGVTEAFKVLKAFAGKGIEVG